MKNKRILCIGMIFFLLTSIQSVQAKLQKHVVNVYVSGADLEQKFGMPSRDLKEMMLGTKGISGEDAYVYVRGRGTYQWQTAQYFHPQVNHHFMQDFDLIMSNGELDGTGPENNEYLNMGSGANLTQFLTRDTMAADAETFIIWGHGSGPVYGLASDPVYNDRISLQELEAALKAHWLKYGRKIKAVVLNSCLMGSLEVADVVAPYADYLVSSESVMTSKGLDFELAIRQLFNNPAADGATIGDFFLDAYWEESTLNGNEGRITFSVIDLKHIPALVESVDRLGNLLIDDWRDGALGPVLRARAKSESYVYRPQSRMHYDLVDIGHFMENLTDEGVHPEEVSVVYDNLKKAVAYNLNSESYPNASGLSLYFPFFDKERSWVSSLKYSELDFAENYEDFVSILADELSKTAPLQVQPVPAAGGLLSPYPVLASQSGSFPMPKASLAFADVQENLKFTTGSSRQVVSTRAFSGKMVNGALLPLYSHPIVFNETTGLVEVQKLQMAVKLQGSLLGLVHTGSASKGETFVSLLKVNGVSCQMQLAVDEPGGSVKLMGIEPDPEKDSLNTSMDSVHLKDGDLVTPIYQSLVSGKWVSSEGASVKLSGTPSFQLVQIADAVSGLELLDKQGTRHWLIRNANGWVDAYAVPGNPDNWAVKEIALALNEELVPDPLLFGFRDAIKRKDFAALCVRLYEKLSRVSAVPPKTNPYGDTSDPHVLKAYQLGIVAPAVRFSPEDTLTREQMAVMLSNTLKIAWPDIQIAGKPLTVADRASVSAWATQAVSFLIDRGVMATSAGKVNPRGTAPKQQAVALAYRLYLQFRNHVPAPPVLQEPVKPAHDIMGWCDVSKGSIEINNFGQADLDLSGWVLKLTQSGHQFVFPANVRLAAGKSILVTTGTNAVNTPPTHFLWTHTTVLTKENTMGGLWTKDGVYAGEVRGIIVIQAK